RPVASTPPTHSPPTRRSSDLALPPRLPDRPRGVPALRPQRGRRAELHAAADVRADPAASDGPRAVGEDNGGGGPAGGPSSGPRGDRKSTRLNSSHVKISYAVF